MMRSWLLGMDNGTEEVRLAGHGNRIVMDHTPAGSTSRIVAGADTVRAGNGDLDIYLDGYQDLISAGAGNHTVAGSLRGLTLHLGAGDAQRHAGAGNDTVTLHGGTAGIWLNGWLNQLAARAGGIVTVHDGATGDLFLLPGVGSGGCCICSASTSMPATASSSMA
jgi:hypothetical protein